MSKFTDGLNEFEKKWLSKPENGGLSKVSLDSFVGLPDDYPCRVCDEQVPGNFTSGIERCDDDPCETLEAWKLKQSNK